MGAKTLTGIPKCEVEFDSWQTFAEDECSTNEDVGTLLGWWFVHIWQMYLKQKGADDKLVNSLFAILCSEF